MLVFNLLKTDLSWHGRIIPPNGGSLNFPEMDGFISDRDRKYETNKVVAFGSLPRWWIAQQKLAKEKSIEEATKKEKIVVKVEDKVPPTAETVTDDMLVDARPKREKFHRR